jgi:hypothetical protein
VLGQLGAAVADDVADGENEGACLRQLLDDLLVRDSEDAGQLADDVLLGSEGGQDELGVVPGPAVLALLGGLVGEVEEALGEVGDVGAGDPALLGADMVPEVPVPGAGPVREAGRGRDGCTRRTVGT